VSSRRPLLVAFPSSRRYLYFASGAVSCHKYSEPSKKKYLKKVKKGSAKTLNY